VGRTKVDEVTGPIAFHGEGPVWSSRWGGLRWLDMLAGDMLTLRADGSVERRHVGSVAAAVRARSTDLPSRGWLRRSDLI
jgi:hypothetical protein